METDRSDCRRGKNRKRCNQIGADAPQPAESACAGLSDVERSGKNTQKHHHCGNQSRVDRAAGNARIGIPPAAP